MKKVPLKWADFGKNGAVFRNGGVGWQLGEIQNQPGGFDEKCLVTLALYQISQSASQQTLRVVEVPRFLSIFYGIISKSLSFVKKSVR